MENIKPTKEGRIYKSKSHEKLTSAEVGKLWVTYMGNSMSRCVLSYLLRHVDDQEIKQVLEQALSLSEEFVRICKDKFVQDNHPVPIAFSLEEDTNLESTRLFEDEFYLHYLKYIAKAGLSIYGIAIPLVTRPDVREFFTYVIDSTVRLLNQVNEIMMAKGVLIRPPYIPTPKHVEFVKKNSYLNGFFGNIRTLHALEITHLYDNVQNIVTSRAVLMAFKQGVKTPRIQEYMRRGEQIATKHFEIFSQYLAKENLAALPLLNHLVTDSTTAPFSEKLMVFHKLDMFSMRMRSYANAMAVNGRHDIAAAYARLLVEVGNYAEDGVNIMIDNGWMEEPPHAANRDDLESR
ncbi:DUF3231 family protein [Paenibacillus caseinilyticus]|uniref:DUF3231 family protein n=1 Tax=Paenibacillus mucilaginosus TaxID=61624 RepID=UPI0005A151F4|nr:DUF3231 family protein [Paenibacillus mucilaginosus]